MIYHTLNSLDLKMLDTSMQPDNIEVLRWEW